MTKPKDPGSDGRKNRPLAVQTMESLIARTDEEGDCLIWKGYIGNGVPQVSHHGKVIAVRRLMLELQGRVLRIGDHAASKCRNPSCVNPEHISHRNKFQHSAAMHSAPRNEEVRAAKLAAFRRKTAKLDMEKAREIRCSDESGPVLAARYGVDKALVSRIRRNEAWREFSNPFAGLGARS